MKGRRSVFVFLVSFAATASYVKGFVSTCASRQEHCHFLTATMPIRPRRSSTALNISASTTFGSLPSRTANWHKKRRIQMLKKYPEIKELEQSHSGNIALPLLIASNLSLVVLSVLSASCAVWKVFLLALFPGSILSLWQLQILHDCLHGSMISKKSTPSPINKKSLEDRILFWGSMPSVFGYFLYLKFGHLSHHRNVGNSDASLAKLFDSQQEEFEDGDILFVAHRMRLKGEVGPKVNGVALSVSRTGFDAWMTSRKFNPTLRASINSVIFASSFMFERILLSFNDVIVAIFGKNFFFPNKPESFHAECRTYCLCAIFVRLMIVAIAGSWKPLLFLYLSETLWSVPPHPASAMFVTNHGSVTNQDGECRPTSSTYAGSWYSLLTLGTNYHCEHHDFPTIPLNYLHKLHKIAPEFYHISERRSLLSILVGAFSAPEFYACLDANNVELVR